MKRIGLLLVAVAGCATGHDWCATPEIAKRCDGYENCVKAVRATPSEPFGAC